MSSHRELVHTELRGTGRSQVTALPTRTTCRDHFSFTFDGESTNYRSGIRKSKSRDVARDDSRRGTRKQIAVSAQNKSILGRIPSRHQFHSTPCSQNTAPMPSTSRRQHLRGRISEQDWRVAAASGTQKTGPNDRIRNGPRGLEWSKTTRKGNTHSSNVLLRWSARVRQRTPRAYVCTQHYYYCSPLESTSLQHRPKLLF